MGLKINGVRIAGIGADGRDGLGVPSGGTDGQVLIKKSVTDYDTEWTDLPSVPTKTSDLTNDSDFVTADEMNATIAAIPAPDMSSKQDKLTGSEGQVVGFDENGNAVAQAVAVDSSLSSTSTNPVQNKVVNTSLSEKENKRLTVTFDPSDVTTNASTGYVSISNFSHTYDEIVESYNAGKQIVVVWRANNGEPYTVFYLVSIYDNKAKFFGGYSNGDRILLHLTIYKNNSSITVGSMLPIASYVTNVDMSEALSSKQDKITGTAGQVVGFDENGNAVAQDAPLGGNSDLIVTFSINGATTSASTGDISIPSFSHTYDEIVTAYNEGKQVLAVCDDDTNHGVFYLTSIETDEVHFIGGGFYSHRDKPVLHLSIYKNAKNGYSGMLLCPANIVNEFEFNQGLSSKQDKITGTAGQFVVIGSDGNVTTKTIANAEEVGF